MLKTIGAIIAGFVTVFILSVITDFILESLHIFPPINNAAGYTWWMLLIALIYRSVYAVLGGYIIAWFSSKKPMRSVWILASIGFIFATLGLLANLDTPVLWYPVLLVVFTIPSVWVGGKLQVKNVILNLMQDLICRMRFFS